MRCLRYNAISLAMLLAIPVVVLGQESIRVLPRGEKPKDSRLAPLKDLNGYFPFDPPTELPQWQRRRDEVQRRMLVSVGLWPLPEKTPLKAVVHGRIDQGDYVVEKVFFESLPGFFVTGNLYRPAGDSDATEKRPGVLCPHGHWNQGRFHDAGLQPTRVAITQGAERFEQGGRSPLQARCVQLARMGCVVFHYDMIGYADCTQISFDLAHRFARQRPEMNDPQHWGLFSPAAESRLQSVMGLQTYNSIRALDFLTELPDVDPERMAVTGASGGGTQTFMLAGIDSRVALSFPAVMVSTAMQGGCTCENACGLRIGTGNVEFAALFAPKPQGLTAADDWTVEMETKGFPQLKQVYELTGAPQNVMLKALTHFGHNYNYVSRAAMYSWVNRHFKLGLPEPIVERDYPFLTREELTVWDAEHPRPEGGDDFERKLLATWDQMTQEQVDAVIPSDADGLRQYRELVGPAVEILFGRSLPNAQQLEFEQTDKQDRENYLFMTGLLTNTEHREQLPLVFLHPKTWNQRVAVWLTEQGKAGLFDAGAPRAGVQRMLDAGYAVVGVDLLYQGEFLDGEKKRANRKVANPRESAAYTYGYNHSVFAKRVHDVLNVIRFVRAHEYQPEQVSLVGLDRTGAIVAASRALARSEIDRAVVHTHGFRFGRIDDIYDDWFLPGGARYHDLPGMLALSAGAPLWLAGESELPRVLQAASRAADARVTHFTGPSTEAEPAALNWLLES